MNDDTLQHHLRKVNWILPASIVVLSAVYESIVILIDSSVISHHLSVSLGILLYIAIVPLAVFWSLKHTRQNVSQYHQLSTDIETSWLASITATSADAIISTDVHDGIVSWNLGAEMLFGYTADEVIGQPLLTLTLHDAAAKIEMRWIFETVRREGFIRRHEMLLRNVANRLINVELTATYFESHQGEDSGISFILRDITNRKRREEETQFLNTNLNQQAIERTRELIEKVELLAIANSELHQLDQTRSDFVSLVSHQIRAPLTNMAGAVQRMQSNCSSLNPTCTRMFAIFDQQVARLDRLVQDVLNVNHIEAGELSIHLEPISVLPVVHQAVQQIEVRTKVRPIHVTDKPGLPLVYADRDRVTEVLTNLLDNADKYSPPREPVFIDIRADQSEVTITVHDSGSGLRVHDLERVFEKFYRADSSDSQVTYGHGLGLYICRRLIEAQNGRIWVENHPSGGAIFSLALPVWEI